MTTYLTIHRAPGLSEEEFVGNAPAVAESKHATFKQIYANLYTGLIVTIYEADSKDAVENEFERVGFPFEEIHEIKRVLDAAALQELVSGQAAS